MMQLIGDWQMKSSTNENKPRPFDIWDWIIIYCTARVGTIGIIGLITGLPGSIWFIIFAACGWWLHEYNVKHEIQQGKR